MNIDLLWRPLLNIGMRKVSRYKHREGHVYKTKNILKKPCKYKGYVIAKLIPKARAFGGTRVKVWVLRTSAFLLDAISVSLSSSFCLAHVLSLFYIYEREQTHTAAEKSTLLPTLVYGGVRCDAGESPFATSEGKNIRRRTRRALRATAPTRTARGR